MKKKASKEKKPREKTFSQKIKRTKKIIKKLNLPPSMIYELMRIA